MVTTRHSQARSSPDARGSKSPGAGSKRAANQTGGPATKAQKKSDDKQQKTLDETMPGIDHDADTEMKDTASTDGGSERDKSKPSEAPPDKQSESDKNEQTKDYREEVKAEANGPTLSEQKKGNGTEKNDSDAASKDQDTAAPAAESDAVHKSSERKAAEPSSILEKGLIYFFFRARVNVDDPSSPADVARSYIVMRPFPAGAELGEGPAKTPARDNRVLALPKKVLPSSPKDRFMVFVEHAGITPSDIEEKVLRGSEYSTKTAGTRHAPPATLVGEGVYALTETGETRSETHLAYILTLPDSIDAVQREMGLAQQGSFVLSAKNPTASGPAQAQLPQSPDFPKKILDAFGSLRWTAAKPEMLDYENAQFLLIGTDDDNLDKATKVQEEDSQEGKAEPKAELEKLEAEDEVRVEKLNGDHAVFADLGASRKAFEGLKTTW